MTRLIDGLVSRNWVERGSDPQDRRRVQIQLTEEGQVEAKRLRRLTEAAIDLVIHKIPKDKRAQVLESITLIRKAMEEARDAVQCC
jgi:DNA-binding MarR family transcriptional regulator